MSGLPKSSDNCLNNIMNRFMGIVGRETGVPVFLDGATYLEKGAGRARVTVNCLFYNSEGILCADLHRRINSGYAEIFSGKSIENMEAEGLSRILFALENNSWTKPEK